jgi:hypothetical protein
MPSSLSAMVSEESERWSEFELPKLSLEELLALAKLLGCPSRGSKETVIVRLLAQRELRKKRTGESPTVTIWLSCPRARICANQEKYRGKRRHPDFSLEHFLSGGTKLTRDYANKIGKPLLHIFDTRK